MARSQARAARRTPPPPRAETLEEKTLRLRLLRQARDAGLLPVPGTVEPAPAPRGAPVLASLAPVLTGPPLDVEVVTKADRRHVPPPPRHDPALERQRDEFLAQRDFTLADVEDLAEAATSRALTPGELAVLIGRLASLPA